MTLSMVQAACCQPSSSGWQREDPSPLALLLSPAKILLNPCPGRSGQRSVLGTEISHLAGGGRGARRIRCGAAGCRLRGLDRRFSALRSRGSRAVTEAWMVTVPACWKVRTRGTAARVSNGCGSCSTTSAPNGLSRSVPCAASRIGADFRGGSKGIEESREHVPKDPPWLRSKAFPASLVPGLAGGYACG
jgi:hypothetical protein